MFRAIKRLFIWMGLMAEKATETDAINQAVVERGIRESCDHGGDERTLHRHEQPGGFQRCPRAQDAALIHVDPFSPEPVFKMTA